MTQDYRGSVLEASTLRSGRIQCAVNNFAASTTITDSIPVILYDNFTVYM